MEATTDLAQIAEPDWNEARRCAEVMRPLLNRGTALAVERVR